MQILTNFSPELFSTMTKSWHSESQLSVHPFKFILCKTISSSCSHYYLFKHPPRFCNIVKYILLALPEVPISRDFSKPLIKMTKVSSSCLFKKCVSYMVLTKALIKLYSKCLHSTSVSFLPFRIKFPTLNCNNGENKSVGAFRSASWQTIFLSLPVIFILKLQNPEPHSLLSLIFSSSQWRASSWSDFLLGPLFLLF